VPGVVVPDAVRERLAAAGDADAQRRVGGDLAVEMAVAVSSRVRGWQVSAPFGRVDSAERVIAGIRAAVPDARPAATSTSQSAVPREPS
jgi:homocysteine S-methyltransferase